MTGIVADGSKAYLEALAAAFDKKVAALRQELDACADPERRRCIVEQIDALKHDLDERKRAADRSLF